MANIKEKFAGRWTLASLVSKGAASDGKLAAGEAPEYPMGQNPGGSIHYDPENNWMHAILETDPAYVPAAFKAPTVIKFVVVFLTHLVRVRVRYVLHRKTRAVGTQPFQLGAGLAGREHLCREHDHVLLRRVPRRHRKESCVP